MPDDHEQRLETYLRREQSLLGRIVNHMADQWHALSGATPSWLLAADRAAAPVQARPAPVVPDFRWRGPSDIAELEGAREAAVRNPETQHAVEEMQRELESLQFAWDCEDDDADFELRKRDVERAMEGEFEGMNEPDWEARCYEDYQRSIRNGDQFKGWSSDEILEWEDMLHEESLEEEVDREEELKHLRGGHEPDTGR